MPFEPSDETTRHWAKHAERLDAILSHPRLKHQIIEVEEEFALAASIVMFHFGRGVRTYRAIGSLVAGNFTQDAMALCRVLLETLFETAFMASHPQDAEKYLEHGISVEKSWAAKSFAHAPELVAKRWKFNPELKNAKSNVNHSSWHPKYRSVKQRAIAGGVQPFVYDFLYSIASRYIHGSGDWIREIGKGQKGPIRIDFGSDRLDQALVIMIACECFLGMLQISNQFLSLEINDLVEDLEKENRQLSGRSWEEYDASI